VILSLWFWGGKTAGRRSLISVGGVFPFFFLLLPLLVVMIFSILRSLR
jgi:hypothetical protein